MRQQYFSLLKCKRACIFEISADNKILYNAFLNATNFLKKAINCSETTFMVPHILNNSVRLLAQKSQ